MLCAGAMGMACALAQAQTQTQRQTQTQGAAVAPGDVPAAASPAVALAADAQPDAQADPQAPPASQAPVDCSADPDQPGCPTPLSRSLNALGAYISAPARWDRRDWVAFGGTLAALGIAHRFDASVRNHFAANAPTAVSNGSPDSVQDALPAAALLLGTWGYAGLIQDEDGRREAHSMLEAGVLSVATAYALGYVARREAPNQTTDPNRWESSGTSFPSEHTALAFAIGTVLAESGNSRYRWIRRVLGYGVAGFTAYERLNHNAHWLSDTVAGAALGAASAHFAMDRQRPAGDAESSLTLEPIAHGVMLSYSLHPR